MVKKPTTSASYYLSKPGEKFGPQIFCEKIQDDVHHWHVQRLPRAFRIFNEVPLTFQLGDYQGHSPKQGDVHRNHPKKIKGQTFQ